MATGVLPLLERVGRAALHHRGLASRHVHTARGVVHAYDGPGGGALPTTAVIHGLGSAAAPFAPVLSRLRRHARRVVAPELPGHGASAAPDAVMTPDELFATMREALDALLPEPAVVCGNSLGGAVALRYAIERPERVRGLVLVSPAGARMADHEWDELSRTFADAATTSALPFTRRLYHRPPWFLPVLAGDVRSLLSRPVVRDLLASVTPDHAATPDELARLSMPVLLVWGRSERLLPASGLAYYREHLPPHAVVEEPHGFGHCPHFDDPSRIARLITDFSRTV